MILHGKDLIVSIDGNANMASKSCTLNVSAKSMVKTSPTSGDWEEVLSGKKSWSLTTNHLVKEATAQTFDPEGRASNFYFSNSRENGWTARGEKEGYFPPLNFDAIGIDEGINLLEVFPDAAIRKTTTFTKDGMYDNIKLEDYLRGTASIDGSTIDTESMIVIMPIGEYVLNPDICNVLEVTYHVSLPCIEFGNSPIIGTKTYDTAPIIIVGGRTGVLDYGYTQLNSISNELNFSLYDDKQVPKTDGIPGAIDMVGEKVNIRMTDDNGSIWIGQAVVMQFKVTGTKGNLMAGSFSFKGNGVLQIDRKEYNVTPIMPSKTVDRIVIDMTKSNPSEMVTGDINGNIIGLVLKDFHRYLCKYQSNGVMAVCQLDDENSYIFFDGSEATLDGTMGDVYVGYEQWSSSGMYVGFYYDIQNIGNGKYILSVSYKQFEGSSYWSNKNLIAAFKAQGTTTYDGNVVGQSGGNYYLRSIMAGFNSMQDTPANLLGKFGTTSGKMNPAYFGLVGPEEHAIVSLLYLIKFGTTNSRGVCGVGNVNAMPTALTAMIGMKKSEPYESVVNLFGLENWWGGGCELMERVTYSNGYAVITNLDGTTQQVAISGSGKPVIKNILMQESPLLMIPQGEQPTNTDYNTHFCSAIDLQTTDGYMCRGYGGEGGGIFSMGICGTDENVGTRLRFRGQSINIITQPGAFRDNVLIPINDPRT